jgi:segregation and condensation protein A
MQDVEHPQTTTTTFAIESEAYSGPLELLVELIERRKFLINDISLAAVTDDYIQHVAILEENPLRETTQFVVLASTLLLIKSKSLLPILELSENEEESVEDLQDRLKLYQLFRNVGKTLQQIYGHRVAYERNFIPSTDPIFITDRFTETDVLASAIQEVIQKLPRKVVAPKVKVKNTVSLEMMIDRLKNKIESQLRLRFNDFTGNNGERTTVIVGFLAVLEMVKQGHIIVSQTAHFKDIEIEREGGATPRYM